MFKKRLHIILSLIIATSVFSFYSFYSAHSENNSSNKNPDTDTVNLTNNAYKFPELYKGIYLNSYSARDMGRISDFTEKAKKIGINTFVLDVQRGSNPECGVPAEIVSYCKKNNIHPIARIVVFPDGLKKFPVPEASLNSILNIAESSCKAGFKEIQFDYIRFADGHINSPKKLTLPDKYNFIIEFLTEARNRLKKYDVKIAADVFGRIPLNQDDPIGQKMEVFDKVADIICPMAYPSHYTWSQKMMADPYYTVFITSKSARERAKNAQIVTYIQAFKMKVAKSNLTFEKYIEEQIKAISDSGVKGYILWNASQKYEVAFKVVEKYNSSIHQEALNK